LALILGGEADLSVVAVVATAAELVAAMAEQEIDLVVLELDVAEWDASGLVAALRQRHPNLAMIGIVAGA
jgi:DNA-binding NtrC family response regulator